MLQKRKDGKRNPSVVILVYLKEMMAVEPHDLKSRIKICTNKKTKDVEAPVDDKRLKNTQHIIGKIIWQIMVLLMNEKNRQDKDLPTALAIYNKPTAILILAMRRGWLRTEVIRWYSEKLL